MTQWVRDANLQCDGYRYIGAVLNAVKTLDQATGGTTIGGVEIRNSDAGAQGQGSLKYTLVGTLLAWKAPGDSAYGTGVDISGSGAKTITSTNGKRIFTFITAASNPAGDTEDTAVMVGIPGHRSITNAKVSGGLTGQSRIALIQPETQGVRFRADGVLVSVTTGPAGLGQPIATTQAEILSSPFDGYSFVEITASAKLHIHYFR